MNRSGLGVGSASIILVFAVLCLTIFTLISYTSANVDKSMLDISLRTVQEYYEADTFAESILAVILGTRDLGMPDVVEGVIIYYENYFNHEIFGSSGYKIRYSCPVSETKNLFVEVVLDASSGGDYEILLWKIQEAGEWEADDSLPVWIPPWSAD